MSQLRAPQDFLHNPNRREVFPPPYNMLFVCQNLFHPENSPVKHLANNVIPLQSLEFSDV